MKLKENIVMRMKILGVLLLCASLIFIVPTLVWYYETSSLQAFKRYLEGIIPCAFVLFPYVVCKGYFRKIYGFIFVAFHFLVSVVESVHLYLYRSTFSMGALEAVFATDIREIYSFLNMYFDIYICILILSNFLVYLLLIKVLMLLDKISLKAFEGILAFCLSGLILIYGPRVFLNRLDVNVFRYWPVYRSFNQVKDFFKTKHELYSLSRMSVKETIKYSFEDGRDFTLICIIGESANRKHQGIYGYQRNTTPFISKEINKLVFDNIYSPAYNTALSHKKLLTLDTTPKVPLISFLQELGCKTWWISGQNLYNNTSPLLFLADHVMSLNDKHGEEPYYDEELIPYIKEAVRSKESKKAIFVNLKGSHFNYATFYPKDKKIFRDRVGIDSPYIDKRGVVDVINDYDNTIAYTDYVISKIIKSLDNTKPIALIYLSDHGQDAYDIDARAYHTSTRNIGYEIPFWIWYNEQYRGWKNGRLQEWARYTHRTGCSDALGFIICDLLGVEIYDKNKSRSFLNVGYQEYKIDLPEP